MAGGGGQGGGEDGILFSSIDCGLGELYWVGGMKCNATEDLLQSYQLIKEDTPSGLDYSLEERGRPTIAVLLQPGTGQCVGEDVRLRGLLRGLQLLGLPVQSPLEADEEGGVDGSEFLLS